MAKLSPLKVLPSAEQIIDAALALLDAIYPSLVIAPPASLIDDPAERYGAGRAKPDFVLEDDREWIGDAYLD